MKQLTLNIAHNNEALLKREELAIIINLPLNILLLGIIIVSLLGIILVG